ncbi:hypothetical protein, partial [Streptomyces hainanensis]
ITPSEARARRLVIHCRAAPAVIPRPETPEPPASAPRAGGDSGERRDRGDRDDALDETRQLPQLGPDRPRPRPQWAEETPLDDLPTLADELLGPHRGEAEGEGEGDDRRKR